MLGFFLLTLLDIASFVNGKAFPGDNYEENEDYNFKQELGSQHQPFHRHQSFPLKTNLYYTPHVNGQPIFIPAIKGSASHTDKLLDDYYDRYKEYTQSWTLATPVTYNHDHENQRDYHEDPVTSNSMVKNLLNDAYQGGVHRGSYHILPVIRESNLNHVTKQTEDFKNKRNTQNLRKKDKKKEAKDFPGLSSKHAVSVNYDTKPVVSEDYSSEASEVIAVPSVDYTSEVVEFDTKLSDDDYAPEVVEVIDTEFSDYSPEVVQIIGNSLPDDDDDYAPGKAEVFNEKAPHEDYAPEVVEVISTELSEEELDPKVEVIGGTFPDDYVPEVVEVINTKFSDYAPEVVQITGNSLPDDDYGPGKAEVFNEKVPHEDYAPEVIEVISTKLSEEELDPKVVEVIGGTFPDDDYAPEMVEVIDTKLPDANYDAEVVEVVNIKNHGRKKPYSPKTELFLEDMEGKDSHKAIDKEIFKSKKDKMRIKSVKKVLKKPSKPSSKTHGYEDIEFVTKMSDKKNKNQSLFTKERETIGEQSSEHLKTVMTKTDLRPDTENFYEFKKDDKTKIRSDKKAVTKPSGSSSKSEDYEVIQLVTKKPNTNKESSQKIRTESAVKHVSEDQYITDEKLKVNKREYEFIDDSESRLVEDRKVKRYSVENTENISEHNFKDNESIEKLGLGTHEALSKGPLNNPESFEAFDLEIIGSGESEVENDENIRGGPQLFHNIDSIRSLSLLNSNIWSLVFNPNAEFKKSKKCVTRSNETGFCVYLQQCDVPNIITSLEELLNNACVIDDVFIGICCPEFPVQTVKVNWEQMPSSFDEHTDDEFGHNADDCGVRSDEAFKTQSWPWKAPLVSMSNGRIFCGGVIMNDDYILTAAHCTTKIPRNQILVRLGQHDDSSGEDFAVVEIKRHAQYNPRTMHNDIALLKLGRRIVRDEQTDAACLPGGGGGDDDVEEKEDYQAGERAVLLGWQKSFSKKSIKDEILEVLTNEECEKRLGVKIPPTFLCTEARKEDERTCNADSGAPLVIKDGDKYKVIGILSWNRDDCDQRFPSTFSRVSKYVQWIKKHAM